jgi:hypothetical protein
MELRLDIAPGQQRLLGEAVRHDAVARARDLPADIELARRARNQQGLGIAAGGFGRLGGGNDGLVHVHLRKLPETIPSSRTVIARSAATKQSRGTA